MGSDHEYKKHTDDPRRLLERRDLGERVTEPELSLGEFRAALLAEMEKSPTIVSEQVAAAQA